MSWHEELHPRDLDGRFSGGNAWIGRVSDDIAGKTHLASDRPAVERIRDTSHRSPEDQRVALLTQTVNQMQITLRMLPRTDPGYHEVVALHEKYRRRLHSALVARDAAEAAQRALLQRHVSTNREIRVLRRGPS